VNDRSTPESAPLHLVFRAAADLAPFDDGPGRSAVLTILKRLAANGDVVVLAFAIRAAEVELLLAPVAGEALPGQLRTALTRGVNRALKRKGTLLADELLVTELDADQDWVALADAIESSIDGEPGDSPATSAFAKHAAWVRQNPSETARQTTPATAPSDAPATIGDVITVADVPTVVQLAAIEPLVDGLRQGDERRWLDALRSYVGRWFLGDRRTLAVVRTVLGSLARQETGGGFFVSGLYGAGKSHLLAALGLAAEFPAARRELFAAHPELRDLANDWPPPPLLVVPVALDACSPQQALEDVVFDAAQQALFSQCRVVAPLAEAEWVVQQAYEHLLPDYRAALDEEAGGEWEQLADLEPAAAASVVQAVVHAEHLPFRFAQSRIERLGRLEELAVEAGCRGVVLLLDELSVFLGSRSGPGLQADAGFLQFLGQRTALSPLWVVAALQKQIEDVGPIEHYTLRQVKDRFETRLSLPLTAAREVLSGKVLPRKSSELAEQAVAACLQHWTGGQRLPDLTAPALRDTYPLHPLAALALEACAERFLAKTRSVIEFAAARVAGDELAPGILPRPATALLCADELWDHFARDLVQHPDLRRYSDLFLRYYEQNLAALLDPGQDAELALRLVKLLAILRLAGLDRGVRDLTAALLPCTTAAHRQVSELLETMRTRGPYLTVERQSGAAGDLYRVDLEFDVNQTIRRRVQSLAASLPIGDARLTTHSVSACRRPEFPLATALHERSLELLWRHTRRTGFVTLQDLRRLSCRELANQAALVSGTEVGETLYLWIAEPQRIEAQAEAFETALAGVADPRWRHALVAWIPREATAAERQVWVEDVAHELLAGDPTLTAGGLGAALLARLDEDSEARQTRLAGLLRRLYGEGAWLTAAGRQPVEVEVWPTQLAHLGELLLPTLYPQFETLAPRGPVDDGVANLLIERLVLPGEVYASPSSVLARDLDYLAVPLGVAVGEAGRYLFQDPPGLGAQALEWLPDREVTVAAAERCWAVSPLGLASEQARLLLAALVRAGHLLGLDDQGQPAALGTPLRSHLAAVRPAPVVDEGVWEAVRQFHETWLNPDWPERDRAGQQAVWDRLLAWRQAALVQVATIGEAAVRTAERCGHEALQWREVDDHGRQVTELAQAIDPGLPAAAGLTRFADHGLAPERLAELRRRHRELRDFAERRELALATAWRALNQAILPAEHELAAERDPLITRFGHVDELVFGADALLADGAAWRDRYTAAYAAWHAAQHATGRFAPYDDCRGGWRMRVLGNLSRLALDHATSAVSVGEALLHERRKQCRRTELTTALSEALACPDCGLLLGESVRLREIAELEAAAEAAIGERLRALQAPEYRDDLRAGLAELAPDDPRAVALRQLLDWQGAPTERLLALTSFAVIDLLNLLLTSPVVGHRSALALSQGLTGHRLTKRQLRERFQQWLDPDGRLDDDDLLQIDP